MVNMGHLVHMPLLMQKGKKGTMTKFARTLEPGIKCNYETVSDECCVIRIDFEREESHRIFVEKYWGE